MTVRALNGVAVTIEAEKYVLCCGGIENARILLLESQRNSGGFGNDHDRVGRYFMQHLRGYAGLVVNAERLSRVQDQFNVLRDPDGLLIEVGLTLTPEIMEREALLNGSSTLQYQGDPESGVTAGQDIWRALQDGHWPPGIGDKVGLIAEDFGEVAQVLGRRLATCDTLASGGVPSKSALLLVDLEAAPDPESRVLLSDDRDALGLCRVKTDCRHGEFERRTATRLASLVGRNLHVWASAAYASNAGSGTSGASARGSPALLWHDPHVGRSTRWCRRSQLHRAWDGKSLCSRSSVFPTAGQANPTMTIVALALRLADHLRA